MSLISLKSSSFLTFAAAFRDFSASKVRILYVRISYSCIELYLNLSHIWHSLGYNTEEERD